ncbi:MAG TPA: hypothetical protein IAB36_00905 [Candidatus Egerieicola pullicola]|uniref:Uncharacterized protein n=1 Tax=Candidatus Egerieicola pullicola TaxID=2840775 RepID=A0A9D1AHM9_9FIRM|nr:hypothetical protein [Candidatus Egerieicola pullicola]
MKSKTIFRRLGAAFTAVILVAGVMTLGVSAEETVTAAQVRQTADAAAEYLTENFTSTGYSASDLATVQLLYRSGLEQAGTVVENYLTQAAEELETYGAAVYQGYDDNYDPVASPSLVGTLGAAWLAQETGNKELSAQMEQAAETLGTPQFIAADNPYNIARALWCAQQLGSSQALQDALAEGLMSYYNQEEQAFDYWGCSVDNNAVMSRGAKLYSGQVAGVAQAAENAMTFVDSLRQADGSYYSDFQWSTSSNADSTGLALSAMADWADSGRYSGEELAQTYQALLDRYYIQDTGAFGYLNNAAPNLMATADVLEGLLTYVDWLEQQEADTPATPSQPEQTPSVPEEGTTSTPAGETPSQNGQSSEAENLPAGEASPATSDDALLWMGGAVAALLLAGVLGAVSVRKVGK